jgi:hypothetical protein
MFFIEVDTQGNIAHSFTDPQATITPVANRIGTPATGINGITLQPGQSVWGYALIPPVQIDEATYQLLFDASMSVPPVVYTWNNTTQQVVKVG